MKRRDDRKMKPQSSPKLSSKLNDIADNIREIQFVVFFLGSATTDLGDVYDDDFLEGSKFCFRMLDKRIQEIIDHADELTSEVKQNENSAEVV